MEVIRRNIRIQCVKDLYEFALANLQEPAPTTYQASRVKLTHRIFFYVDKLDPRLSGRRFKESKGNVPSTVSCQEMKDVNCQCDVSRATVVNA